MKRKVTNRQRVKDQLVGRILMADLQATHGRLESRLPGDFQATPRQLPGDSKFILATSPLAGDFQATRRQLAEEVGWK